MIRSRNFAKITAADAIVRSAYQMGKTPLLPLYAASLGAGDAYLGLIVSISTLTGMLTKPLFGVLSDRWGRRSWLIIGTAFFAFTPFAYHLVDTPGHLLIIRLIHGISTAIYGPVTLAYVAEQSKSNRAERLAWFGTARNAGYIVGPLAAGWMLLTMDPVSVFTIVGIISTLAFVPILMLPVTDSKLGQRKTPFALDALRSLVSGGRTPAVWLAGSMESTMFLALYATKTFLPIYALSAGFNIAVVGIFFAVQEGAHILLNPVGGRLGDRFGYLFAVPIGMVVLAISLPLLTIADNIPFLMALAVLMGLAQSIVFPSTVALIASQMGDRNLATGMGLVGTMKNAGKVAGPAMAGALITWVKYDLAFVIIGLLLFAGAVAFWQRSWTVNRRKRRSNFVPGARRAV